MRILSKSSKDGVDGDEIFSDIPSLGIDPLGGREKKVAELAKMLRTSERRAAREFYHRMITALPEKARADYLLPGLKIKTCKRISDELVRIEIQGDRIFLGQRSNQKEYLLHRALWPYLPEQIDGDAYKLALDIQRRYIGQRLRWYNSNGGVFVEGGCFTGMKAIRWHDISPKPVRILAVEIGATNANLLRVNLRENGLESSIIPIHAGLWSESGEGVQKHSFSTRRFLEASDTWKGSMAHEEKTRLLSIRDLLDQNEVDVVDYFNLQVNGAEIEVLKGAANVLERVKIFDVAALYSQDGKRNINVVRKMMTDMGYTIIQETDRGRIAMVAPKFRDEILARKPTRHE